MPQVGPAGKKENGGQPRLNFGSTRGWGGNSVGDVNNFWPGIILVGGSIYIFWIVIFRPASLKSVRRSRSKYHLSRLGAASCGFVLFAVGVAKIMNGLGALAAVYVESVFIFALFQLMVVGFYDTYRKSRLGSRSPFYVGLTKGKNVHKEQNIALLLTLVLLVGLASVIQLIVPTLTYWNLKLFATIGAVILCCAVYFVLGCRSK